MAKLPRSARGSAFGGTLDRALDDPARFLARLYPDIGACQLAAGMLGHPEWTAATLAALGWMQIE